MKLCRIASTIAFSLVVASATRAEEFHLEIIALNDFHGNLQSPGQMRANAQSPSVPVGGIDYFAGYIAKLKSENPDNVVVSAGDLTGGGPLISSLFHDEDTIETMNRIGLEINGVGNHEFDKGRKELLRLQKGGCSTLDKDTCEGKIVGTPYPFEGAKFTYLAANVFDTATGKTIFPGYAIKTYHGVKVAFIGVTLKETPSNVTPSAIIGLRFADEAETINPIVRRLRQQGIESFVVLLHQGGFQSTRGTPDINACEGGLSASAVPSIVSKLDDAVDLVISAHTHVSYVCQMPNRSGRNITVTSASSYGRALTQIDVTIDTATKDFKAVAAHNLLVDRTNPAITPDAALEKIVDRYAELAAPIINRVVGSVAADIPKTGNAAGESPLGDLIADAQLEATAAPGSGGAVIAFMNEAGYRTDLHFHSETPGVPDGNITYGELFSSQPFGNSLVTMTLTGAQIKTMLEEQFKGCALDAPPDSDVPTSNREVVVSEGFTFTWSQSAAPCNKIDPKSIKLHGVTINPAAKYRVTVNSFLADGGGQFYVLKEGTDRVVGPLDVDALTTYFTKHPSVKPIPPHRITVVP